MLGQRRPVVHLDAGDPLGADGLHERHVAGPAGMVPDVHAHPAVGPVGVIHDAQRISRRDDVGERQELQADHQPVIGGTVAQRRVRVTRLADGAVVRPDGLQVTAAPAVGHLPRGGLHGEVVGCRLAGQCPPSEHLDLGHAHGVGVEDVLQPTVRQSLCRQALVLADVQADAGESGGGRSGDTVFHGMQAVQAEVAQHEVGAVEVARRSGSVHRFSITSQRSACEPGRTSG